MKPILFNTEMVKAILDGRKTVTRRNPFKFEMKEGYNPEWTGYSLGEYFTGRIETGVCLYSRGAHDAWGVRSNAVKPKYLPGDILYVRETWGIETVYGKCGTFGFDAVYKADKKIVPVIIKDWDRYIEIGKFFDKTGWQPSLFMPKEAARIYLRVTGVRVERLQDMENPDDSNYKSEGVKDKHDFIRIWDSTVGDIEKLGWYANPWAWVIEFERISKEDICREKLSIGHGI